MRARLQHNLLPTVLTTVFFSSLGFQFVFYELSRHPDVQRRLQREIDAQLDALGKDQLEYVTSPDKSAAPERTLIAYARGTDIATS